MIGFGTLAVVLLTCGVVMVANLLNPRDLRGYTERSPDGRTYLVVDPPARCVLWIDGRPWPHRVGVAGVISPGRHEIECLDPAVRPDPAYRGIGFNVPPGEVFHFDYWGP